MTGPSTWTVGTQTGTGTTEYDSALTITGTVTKTLTAGRILNLNGPTSWSGNTAANNSITLSNGTLNNNGTFTDPNAFAASLGSGSGGGTNAFNNASTYNKEGNSTTSVGGYFGSGSRSPGRRQLISPPLRSCAIGAPMEPPDRPPLACCIRSTTWRASLSDRRHPGAGVLLVHHGLG